MCFWINVSKLVRVCDSCFILKGQSLPHSCCLYLPCWLPVPTPVGLTCVSLQSFKPPSFPSSLSVVALSSISGLVSFHLRLSLLSILSSLFILSMFQVCLYCCPVYPVGSVSSVDFVALSFRCWSFLFPVLCWCDFLACLFVCVD